MNCTVFAVLKVTGKHNNSTGIDTCLVKAEIYGIKAVEQTYDGSHMQREIEARTIISFLVHIATPQFFKINLELACIVKQKLKEFQESLTESFRNTTKSIMATY